MSFVLKRFEILVRSHHSSDAGPNQEHLENQSCLKTGKVWNNKVTKHSHKHWFGIISHVKEAYILGIRDTQISLPPIVNRFQNI